MGVDIVDVINRIKGFAEAFFKGKKYVEPKISVIIPCYNSEEYLEKCLISLIRQTLREIEVICVDDGSTDKTLEILRAFEVEDERIIVLTQENKKQGAARNAGLKAAKGEYIGFVDADDWVDEDYYEKLYSKAREHGYDIALADYVRVGNGKTKHRLNIIFEEKAETLEDKFKLCDQAKNPCPTNKIYRAEFLKENNIEFPEGVYCEDKLFTCKAVYYANGVVSVPDTYYYYYRRPDSTVRTKDAKKEADKIKANRDVLEFLRSKNVQLNNDIFWAVKSDIKLLGVLLMRNMESLRRKKYLLFGKIPVLVKKLNPEKESRRSKRKEFKNLYKNKIEISPYYSTDYNEPSNIDLYTISFNNPRIIDYQIKLMRKNLRGKYRHIICDNSNQQDRAEEIKMVCEANNITYVRVTIDMPSGYSDSHGRALNWVYENIIKERRNDYGFIDHDLMPVEEVNIEDYLKDSPLCGFVRRADKIWFLWPGFSFFRYDYVMDKKLNYRKYKFMHIFHHKGADSGSGNWDVLYKFFDETKLPEITSIHYDILNECPPKEEYMRTGYSAYIQTNLSQYLDGKKWFHSICGGEWRDNVKQKNKVVYDLLDKYLKK